MQTKKNGLGFLIDITNAMGKDKKESENRRHRRRKDTTILFAFDPCNKRLMIHVITR